MMFEIVVLLVMVDMSQTGILPPSGESSYISGDDDILGEAGAVVGAVLEATSQPRCSVILLTDGTTQPYTIIKVVGQARDPWGVGVFQVVANDQEANVTQAMLSMVVSQARRLRQLSWCVTVVVVSDDPAFIAAFAQWSLKGRLLVWSTRLLVLTRLPLQELQGIIRSSWTFTMMNVMFLIISKFEVNRRCLVYSHMPYSARGAEVVRVASWGPARGLAIFRHQRIFPEKFSNFHGATVPITGLPWPPYIIEFEETATDGSTVKKYKGPDGLLLRAIADTLNFTFIFLPVKNWVEAVERVVERKSFMVPVYHVMLHTRLERYDYSYPYVFVSFGFGMAKPHLKPQWQSMYYPLADEVWASTLAALLMMAGFMYMFSMSNKGNFIRTCASRDLCGGRGIGVMIQEAFGTLLGQNISQWLPRASSSRVLVAAWLVFAFIIGTVYRGNLTAALTLPKYPPRPETLEELVNYVDRVTMPPFGKDFKRQFKESGSRTMEKLADLMHTGPSVLEGLKQALEEEQAHLAARHAINHWIAERFTGADGSSLIYFGKERIDPGASSWPIPHDAPYKRQLDRIMTAVNEAGLYDKWTDDTVDEARRDGQMKRRERRQDEEEEKAGQAKRESPNGSSKSSKALTIIHTQGPLMLLLLGHILAGLTFITEILSIRYCH